MRKCLVLWAVLSCSAWSWGVAPFITHNYIELQYIEKISRFRSGVGHDYSYTETNETCRSMKHYFVPYQNLDWSTIKLFSPVSGTIFKLEAEWVGYKIHLWADAPENVEIILFHMNPKEGLAVGSHVTAGEIIGTYSGNDTSTDIAINYQGHLRSYFELITDDVFQEYRERGVTWRYAMIITKGERDADPLTCDGTTFLTHGTVPNWVELNPPAEGASEGGGEGVSAEGALEEGEGLPAEGSPEEGEGLGEGEGEIEGEGGAEGVNEGGVEGEGANEGEGEGQVQVHSADQNADGQIGLSELLRVIQFFNSNGLHCEAGSEDGYAPGAGDETCVPHSSDYAPRDWRVGLSEVLRLIQFFNSSGYRVCEEGGDGFCPGTPEIPHS